MVLVSPSTVRLLWYAFTNVALWIHAEVAMAGPLNSRHPHLSTLQGEFIGMATGPFLPVAALHTLCWLGRAASSSCHTRMLMFRLTMPCHLMGGGGEEEEKGGGEWSMHEVQAEHGATWVPHPHPCLCESALQMLMLRITKPFHLREEGGGGREGGGMGGG